MTRLDWVGFNVFMYQYPKYLAVWLICFDNNLFFLGTTVLFLKWWVEYNLIYSHISLFKTVWILSRIVLKRLCIIIRYTDVSKIYPTLSKLWWFAIRLNWNVCSPFRRIHIRLHNYLYSYMFSHVDNHLWNRSRRKICSQRRK